MKSIMDVCADAGLQLTKIGDGIYRSFCCFHNDQGKPNLTIYEKTNSFHCFSCSHGGDPIWFVKLYYNKSYEDSIKHVYNDSLEDYVSKALEAKEDGTDYKFMLNKVISGRCYAALKDGGDKVKVMQVMQAFDKFLSETKEIDTELFIKKMLLFSEGFEHCL